MDDKLIKKEIREAIKAGDAEKVAALIGEDPSRLSMQTVFGTWLHVAAAKGQLEIVKQLVAMGADINANGGIAGGTALHEAASDGHAEVVKHLLTCGAKLDTSEPQVNPLFAAIRAGHTEIVKRLIDAGIDTSVSYTGARMKNTDALAWAKEWGRRDIVALLGGTFEEPTTTEAKPSREDTTAIRDGSRAAAEMLKLSGKEKPDRVVAKIQKYLDDFAAGTAKNPLGDDAAVALGALWGNAVCEAFGWEWIVPKRGNWSSLGVVDAERRWLALPFNLFHKVMHDDPKQEMPGPLVRFNAIAANHLPASEPQSFTVITS